MRHLPIALVALAISFGGIATADEGEAHAVLSAGPVYGHQVDTAPTGAVSRSSLGVGVQALGLYAVLHELEVGGALGATYYPRVALPAGGAGALLEDAVGVGAAGVCVGRWETGYRLAPYLSLQLGLEYVRQMRRQWQPAGAETAYAVELEAASQWALAGRLAAGVEFRVEDHWVLSLGVGYRRSLARGAPWQLEVPLALGWIW